MRKDTLGRIKKTIAKMFADMGTHPQVERTLLRRLLILKIKTGLIQSSFNFVLLWITSNDKHTLSNE